MTAYRTLCDGVESLCLPDNRFKTVRLSAVFLLPLREETAAEYALLPFLLRRSCAAYPDLTALNRRLNELYGARIFANVTRVGEAQALILTAVCLKDRYALSGEALTTACAQLLRDMLFAPALEDGLFRPADVEQERRCLVELIQAEINDKRRYARRQCERMLCAGEAYAVSPYGEAGQAMKLTPGTVTEAWKRMLRRAQVRLILQGLEDPGAAEEAFRQQFAALPDRQPEQLTTDTAFVPKDSVRRQTEAMPVEQCKLVMGFRAGTAEPDGGVAAARLMNALLGGTPHSLLFRHVREEKSLCYYCQSSYDRLKGILLVDSGVEADKIGEAETEILRQLDAVRAGQFSDDDLEAARLSVINQFLEIGDLPSSQMNWYLGQSLLDRQTTPEEAADAIRKVTREDVCAAAQRVRPDCVYCLKTQKEGQA